MRAVVPGRDDHGQALRVLVALAVPVSIMVATGRPELLVYAAFGSFAGMYGRRVAGRQRIVRQVQAAGLLVGGVAIGVALAATGASTTVLILVETGYAVVGSVLADIARLRPVGPFFFIFGLGAAATVPAGVVAPIVAIVVCAATAVLAIAVGTVGMPRPFDGPPWTTGLRVLLRTPPSGVRVHALRYGIAVFLSGSIGMLLGFDHANWAMAAAAVPLAAADGYRPVRTAVPTLRRAAHRTIGTLSGLLLAAGILALGPEPAIAAVVAALLLWPTELFMGRHYAVAIGFFTPLIMLMTELTAPGPPLDMLVQRGADTVIGVAIGSLTALCVRGPARRRRR
nr:FUSC family protein [Gordonia humi]